MNDNKVKIKGLDWIGNLKNYFGIKNTMLKIHLESASFLYQITLLKALSDEALFEELIFR